MAIFNSYVKLPEGRLLNKKNTEHLKIQWFSVLPNFWVSCTHPSHPSLKFPRTANKKYVTSNAWRKSYPYHPERAINSRKGGIFWKRGSQRRSRCNSYGYMWFARPKGFCNYRLGLFSDASMLDPQESFWCLPPQGNVVCRWPEIMANRTQQSSSFSVVPIKKSPTKLPNPKVYPFTI